VRQPLLRGNGAEINRIPLLLARIRTDVSLAEFEANVRNQVLDVENAYWELYCAYQILETVKTARDSTLVAWDINHARQVAGVEIQGPVTIGELEAQARNQYFNFRFQTEQALNELYNAETNLRWLMGLASSDGRLIRPTDEPSKARVEFDWYASSEEALARSPELRQIKWFIKQRELEQIAARNRLLPDLNAAALYRWVGAGDQLINADRNGLNFPAPGSTAFDVLTEGKFEEAQIGFDFAFPVGFRQEYSQVRNAQINLAREHARLEDGELNVTTTLAQAIRNMQAQYAFAQSHFNSLIAATQETRIAVDRVRGGLNIYTDNALRAIQRQADSQRLFFRALCEYNKNIALVHFRKNSLLEYNNVLLREGPWPAKAYFDAEGHARRRAAGYYLDYGWTAPPPVSIGPVPQQWSGSGMPADYGPLPAAAPPAATEPIPAPPPTPDPLMEPGGPGLLPAPPPGATSRRIEGRPDVLPTAWNQPAARPAMPPAELTPATAYPAYYGGAPSAMPYRGLGSPSAAPSRAAPPHSSRRTVAPASYLEPAGDEPVESYQRLPPTAALAP
jgi:outer membrane protein TolC